MKKIYKNIVLAIVSLSLTISTASAGDFSVTGAVKASYSIMSSASTTGNSDQGKGIGIANEFTLGASGELDNGWTWKYAQDIDGATVQDDASIVFGLGDAGNFAIMVSEGSLSQKYGFDASAYGVGSDTGYGGGSGTTTVMQYGGNIGSYNNFQYHLPAILPFGMTAKVAVAPNAGGNGGANASLNAAGSDNAGAGDSAYEVQLTAKPVDGLSIGVSYFSLDTVKSKKQDNEAGSVVAKYSMGPVTIGYGRTLYAPNLDTVVGTSTVTHYDNRAYSIGFKVNDGLSLSYTNEESERFKKLKDAATDAITRADTKMEIDTIQAAYTVGGMTLSVSNKDVDGDSYSTAGKVKETLIGLALAF